MYVLSSKIEISGIRKWDINYITEVEIIRDTEKLTDECKITIPKKIKWDGEKDIPVKRGDTVKVQLGYDNKLEIAFVGYVRDIGCKTPIVISCEDEMFKLKSLTAKKKAYKNVTLLQLLKDQGLPYDIRVMGEQHLGQYRVTSDTVASLLGKLQKNGIRSFFRYEGGKTVLYAGVLFDSTTSPSQVFSTGINIINDYSLEQQRAENMRIYVKAISLMPNNKKIKIEIGDADGERRTIHTYNKTEKELKAWAEQEIKRLKRSGLKGSLTTFGHTLVDKLDAIGVKIDGNKMGVYQVNKNVIKYGSDGYRQEITLGQRVAE